MTLRPLRVAFTALTLSLVVSLSLWVLHASHEQRQFSHAVALQMSSAPAEINSHEVLAELNSSSQPKPFAKADSQPQMVELEEPPELIGIEAAPVSQNSSKEQAPPPFPSVDEIEDLPELSLQPPADEGPLEFPPLDPAGPEAEGTDRQPEPPREESMPQPLSAPRPPAWLSAQATLEAEIDDLRQQQKSLEVALSDRHSTEETWKERERNWHQQQQAWNDEKKGLMEQLLLAQKEAAETQTRLAESDRQIASIRKLLETSKQDATDFQQQIGQLDALLKESHTVNAELKDTLKQKLSAISRLENDARKSKYEIDKLRKQRFAAGQVPQDHRPHEDSAIRSIEPSENPAPTLLPPLPDQVDNVVQPDVVQDAPLVPRLAGRTDPPADTEQLAPADSNPSRTPLIAAAVGPNADGRCARCGTSDVQPPGKKGLVYDLRDWFDEWHLGRDFCSVCKPICNDTGHCVPTEGGCEAASGLVPDLVNWWKHRGERCDCGCQ